MQTFEIFVMKFAAFKDPTRVCIFKNNAHLNVNNKNSTTLQNLLLFTFIILGFQRVEAE